jgi:hypothetical protein
MATGEGSLWISCHSRTDIWLPQESKTYRMDPRTHEIVAVLPLCGNVAVGEGAVWIRQHSGKPGLLSKVDPRTNQVVSTLALKPGEGEMMVVGEGGVWLSGKHEFGQGGHIVRVDPRTNEVAALIPLDKPVSALAVGEGAVWVLAGGIGKHEVWRIDPHTNEVVARIPVTWTISNRLVAGEGWVWLVELEGYFIASSLAVTRINPATNQVEGERIVRPRMSGTTSAVAVGLGGLWFTEDTGKRNEWYTLVHIDARTGQIQEMPASTTPMLLIAIAIGDQAIWVGSSSTTSGTVLDCVRP